jgi:nitrogen regulatory protein P-II 1
MKYVVGVVPPAALEMVQGALGEAEIFRLTISEVEVVQAVGDVPPGGLDRGLRLEIAVNDDFLAPALSAFDRARDAGHLITVSVLPLDDAVRIRTGERGPEAI